MCSCILVFHIRHGINLVFGCKIYKSRGTASLFLPYLALVLGGLLLFAALTEFLQFITFDRGPGIFDLLIDTSFIVTGMALAWFLKHNKLPRRKRTGY